MCRSLTAWLLVCLWIPAGFLILSTDVAFGDESVAAGSDSALAESQEHSAVADSESAAHKDSGHEHDVDHATSHSADEHAKSGPPMEFTKDLALWSLVVFVLFLAILKKFAWLPMIEGLDKREAGIRKAISDAEDGRRKSEALLAEYEQKLKNAEQTVHEMVAEARRDAERTSQDLIAGARREVEAIRDRATDDIRQAKDTALAEVFTQINSQVVQATEHVLGRALQDGDQDRLVSQALAEISR
jgi:F-type H+-transporting ATPase subunit b